MVTNSENQLRPYPITCLASTRFSLTALPFFAVIYYHLYVVEGLLWNKNGIIHHYKAKNRKVRLPSDSFANRLESNMHRL